MRLASGILACRRSCGSHFSRIAVVEYPGTTERKLRGHRGFDFFPADDLITGPIASLERTSGRSAAMISRGVSSLR